MNIQEIRVALYRRLLDIHLLASSRECALASTHCQQARMLLGVSLKLGGGATPYPESDNPASNVVAPAADIAEDYQPNLPVSSDGIAAIKWIRAELEKQIVELAALRRELWARCYGTLAETVFDAAFVELCLAKNWLGMELVRIADEKARVPPPADNAHIADGCEKLPEPPVVEVAVGT